MKEEKFCIMFYNNCCDIVTLILHLAHKIDELVRLKQLMPKSGYIFTYIINNEHNLVLFLLLTSWMPLFSD